MNAAQVRMMFEATDRAKLLADERREAAADIDLPTCHSCDAALVSEYEQRFGQCDECHDRDQDAAQRAIEDAIDEDRQRWEAETDFEPVMGDDTILF